MRRGTLYCSFCGKTDADVAYIVSGPSVFICNECVDVCCQVIMNHFAKRREKVMQPGDLGLSE